MCFHVVQYNEKWRKINYNDVKFELYFIIVKLWYISQNITHISFQYVHDVVYM